MVMIAAAADITQRRVRERDLVNLRDILSISAWAMPSTIKLRIIEARDLPVMDRKSGLTDAYVSLSFGEQTDKTSICRKTSVDSPDDINNNDYI